MVPHNLPLGYDERAARYVAVVMQAKALSFANVPLKLTDGSPSHFYIDHRVITDPAHQWDLATLFADCIMQKLGPDGFDVVFGPAYGGIAFAVNTSQALWQQYAVKKPFTTARQGVKEYGKSPLLIGAPLKGRRVVVLDDLVKGGTTKLAAYHCIEEHGGSVAMTVVGLDRSSDPQVVANLADATGAPVRALATLEDLAHELGFDTWAACEAAKGLHA